MLLDVRNLEQLYTNVKNKGDNGMDDAKRIMKELAEDLSPEEMKNETVLKEQIRMLAEEDSTYFKRVFEIGLNEVVETSIHEFDEQREA